MRPPQLFRRLLRVRVGLHALFRLLPGRQLPALRPLRHVRGLRAADELRRPQLPSGACQYCVDGYYVAANGRCVASLPRCLQHATAGCVACAPGFFLQTSASTCSGQDLWTPLYTSAMYGGDVTATPVCVAGRVGNCTQQATASTCAVCASGFFLTTALQCSPVTTQVSRCVTYSNATQCAACAQGYYLENNTCVANPSISNPIPNCMFLFPFSKEFCQFCEQGFLQDSNGVCQQIPADNIIPNCSFYISLYQCGLCSNFYYWNGTACTPEDSNCISYGKSKCVSCTNNKTAVLSRCDLFGGPEGCQVFEDNTCAQCLPDYRPFIDSQNNSACQFVGSRDGCLGYSINGSPTPQEIASKTAPYTTSTEAVTPVLKVSPWTATRAGHERIRPTVKIWALMEPA